MKGVTVTKDIGEAVLRNIEKMDGARVLIGIPANKTARQDDGQSNAALGYLHENGSPRRNIPARPFLVPAVKDAAPKLLNVLKASAADATTDPLAIDKGLNRAGLLAQAAVKNWIRNGVGFAPLSPETIAMRQEQGYMGTKPLIRTGQLLNSINYVVINGKG